jgi:hypothetical protein
MPPHSRAVLWLGYIGIAGGILSAITDVASRKDILVPTDMGVVVAECTLGFVGYLAVVISKSLRGLEDRVARIERNRE